MAKKKKYKKGGKPAILSLSKSKPKIRAKGKTSLASRVKGRSYL